MAKKPKKSDEELINDFFDAAESERNRRKLYPLNFDTTAVSHANAWPDYKKIAVKRHRRGIILLARLHLSNPVIEVSVSEYRDHRDHPFTPQGIPWWHESGYANGLKRAIMRLPYYYKIELPIPDMDLEEIIRAQDLVDGV